jgi:hypothetical protein
MPKYYAIPINNSNMYLPVRAAINPYGPDQNWCQSMPQVIGGADRMDEGPWPTLVREAHEESHGKITLDPAANATLVHKAAVNNTANYFYQVANAQYNAAVVLPAATLQRRDYRETTGAVIVADMNNAPSATRIQLARYLVPLTGLAYTEAEYKDFFESQSLIAIWKVVNRFRGKTYSVEYNNKERKTD